MPDPYATARATDTALALRAITTLAPAVLPQGRSAGVGERWYTAQTNIACPLSRNVYRAGPSMNLEVIERRDMCQRLGIRAGAITRFVALRVIVGVVTGLVFSRTPTLRFPVGMMLTASSTLVPCSTANNWPLPGRKARS